MKVWEIVFISFGLAMDAFAVSVCKGLSMRKMDWKKAAIIAAWFGFFQMMMPVAGYYIGAVFKGMLEKVAHWIAFVLLTIVGINMIRESGEQESDAMSDSIDFRTMILLAVATSIDALAVGFSFAMLRTSLIVAAISIGIITFFLSLAGVSLGQRFGNRLGNKAELLGGLVLVAIGVKIVLEHMGILHI